MQPRDLNRTLSAAAERLEEAYLAKLTRKYELVFGRAGKLMVRAFQALATPLPITAAADEPPHFIAPDPDEILNADELAADVKRRAGRTHAQIADALQAELEAAGVSFDVGGLFSEELLEAVGHRATFAADRELRDAFRAVIAQAMDEGWSVPTTTQAIRESVASLAGYRAEALARTDLIGLANAGGQRASARAFAARDDVHKTWVATMDPRTRPEHLEAHGQSVPLNEYYTVGGEPLMFPGDPQGTDEMVINCRCTQIYGDEPGGKVVRADAGDGLTAATRALAVTLPTSALAMALPTTALVKVEHEPELPGVPEPDQEKLLLASALASRAEDMQSLTAAIDRMGDKLAAVVAAGQRAPEIIVNVPEQAAPVVTVPEPLVVLQEQPAPVVNVNVPEQEPPVVNVHIEPPAPRRIEFDRDRRGKIVGAQEVE